MSEPTIHYVSQAGAWCGVGREGFRDCDLEEVTCAECLRRCEAHMRLETQAVARRLAEIETPAGLAFSKAPAGRSAITVTVSHDFSGGEAAMRADLAQHLEGVAGISRVTVERAEAPPAPGDSRVTLTSREEKR